MTLISSTAFSSPDTEDCTWVTLMNSIAPSAALVVVLSCTSVVTTATRTFGSGMDGCGQNTQYCRSRMACAGVSGGPPQSYMPILNHTLSTGSKLGIMDHFWWCQGDEGLSATVAGWIRCSIFTKRLSIDYAGNAYTFLIHFLPLPDFGHVMFALPRGSIKATLSCMSTIAYEYTL